MITTEEKDEAIIGVNEVASAFRAYPSLFKYVIKGLNPKNPTVRVIQSIVTEQSFKDGERLEELARILFKGIIEDDIKEEERVYTPSELAEYFGVSRQTVNKWVNAGRFTNTIREGSRNHIQIGDNDFFITPNGEQLQVKEIISNYNQRYQELSEKQAAIELKAELKYFEDKYDKDLGKFMELKKADKLSNEQKDDLEEWIYFQDKYDKL